mgnify:CR=1 FL=1
MFSNLMRNAWKFTRLSEKPKITIAKDENEKIMIKDNGTGFDMKYVDKIFEPFQRLHSTDDYKGTGIGLTIVKRIIQRHGSDISVQSVIGEGTTFYLTLE